MYIGSKIQILLNQKKIIHFNFIRIYYKFYNDKHFQFYKKKRNILTLIDWEGKYISIKPRITTFSDFIWWYWME